MRKAIVVAAALLASALGAHAAPIKKHVRLVNGRACHEFVVTEANALSYGLGIASGQIPLPRMECYTRARASGSGQDTPSYDLGPSPSPSPDSSPAPAGPDTAGMNTSTNPTWSGL
jgi:hypothetical protein